MAPSGADERVKWPGVLAVVLGVLVAGCETVREIPGDLEAKKLGVRWLGYSPPGLVCRKGNGEGPVFVCSWHEGRPEALEELVDEKRLVRVRPEQEEWKHWVRWVGEGTQLCSLNNHYRYPHFYAQGWPQYGTYWAVAYQETDQIVCAWVRGP